jgi:hypothetical protein
MTQTVMTFIAAIEPSRISELKEILSVIGANPSENTLVPFGNATSLHFSSMVIFDRPGLDPILVWENNFDGTLDSYTKAQLSIASDGLHRVFQCCRNYPGAHHLEEYLKACAVPAELYHIGAPGRTVERIKGEAAVRSALQDRLRGTPANSAVAEARAMRHGIGSDSGLSWATMPEPSQPVGDRVIAWIRVILLIAGTLITLPLWIVPVLILAVVIRVRENTDHENHDPVPHRHLRRLLATEDRTTLNHMASVTRVKPGKLRLLIVRVFLWAGNILVRVQNRGTLGGISGIHYAHWSLIDHGKWLLFLTNYTGSWASYLDDFIERASGNLSVLWSNTGGFPRTKWLYFDGARNGLLFKTYARNSQAETLVWYSAYPQLTVQNVNKNTKIRNGLSADVDSEEKQKAWLRMI